MKKTLSAALVALLALFMAVGSFPVSAKTGAGMNAWEDWLLSEWETWQHA